MAETNGLPEGVELVRVTDDFDETTHPAGILRAHRVADGVWARLVVRTGELGFVFEDAPGETLRVTPDRPRVIPPARLHHVEIDGPVIFALEFYRRPDRVWPGVPEAGRESTGLS